MSKQEQKTIEASETKLCAICNKMYGNVIFDYFCSKCFRLRAQPASNDASTINSVVTKEAEISCKKPQGYEDLSLQGKRACPESQQVSKGKCGLCARKTGLLGYSCTHCTGEFCRMHRLPENHQCTVDFISQGRKKLKLQLISIKCNKISQV